MADHTDFAGLTRLDPGESLADDGYSFQAENPTIIDAFLKVGALTHRHDAHDPLADPTLAPDLAVVNVGGTIPADTDISVLYTLLDVDGGETLPVDPAVIVSTPAGLAAPDNAPTAVPDQDAGTLVPGTYTYAITVTDDFGGETTIGPVVVVTIDPGSATNEVVLSDLSTIVDDSDGTGWRLYRSLNGSPWAFLAAGATDTVTDDGGLCADCQDEPPLAQGTTNAANVLQVTVPDGQPTEAASFRIYASVDGQFTSPSLLGEYPIADTGSVKSYTSLDLQPGAPPDVSRCVGGASKINALTDIANLSWKPPVAAKANLSDTGNSDGDVRLTLDDDTLHAWDDGTSAWKDIGGSGGGGALTWEDVKPDAGMGASTPGGEDAWQWALGSDGLVHLRGVVQVGSGFSIGLAIADADIPADFVPTGGNGRRMVAHQTDDSLKPVRFNYSPGLGFLLQAQSGDSLADQFLTFDGLSYAV